MREGSGIEGYGNEDEERKENVMDERDQEMRVGSLNMRSC